MRRPGSSPKGISDWGFTAALLHRAYGISADDLANLDENQVDNYLQNISHVETHLAQFSLKL